MSPRIEHDEPSRLAFTPRLDTPAPRLAVVVAPTDEARELLIENLEQQGFRVHAVSDGFAGMDAVRVHRPEILTVDVALPGMDGYETVRRIREFHEGYVVMVAEPDDEAAIVAGFHAGADEYIVQPWGRYELRARIEALLRRPRVLQSMPERDEWVEHGELRMHPLSRRVEVARRQVPLTRSEFDILLTLLNAGSEVLSKARLALMLRAQNGLRGDHVNAHDLHAVEMHIMNLRRKLRDDPRTPRWVETVRGLGYRVIERDEDQRISA